MESVDPAPAQDLVTPIADRGLPGGNPVARFQEFHAESIVRQSLHDGRHRHAAVANLHLAPETLLGREEPVRPAGGKLVPGKLVPGAEDHFAALRVDAHDVAGFAQRDPKALPLSDRELLYALVPPYDPSVRGDNLPGSVLRGTILRMKRAWSWSGTKHISWLSGFSATWCKPRPSAIRRISSFR